MIAKCTLCDGEGEIDSGAPDPQGRYIGVQCPECRGVGKFDTQKGKPTRHCCGMDIYEVTHGNDTFYVAVDPDWEMLVESNTDHEELCNWLNIQYLCC